MEDDAASSCASPPSLVPLPAPNSPKSGPGSSQKRKLDELPDFILDEALDESPSKRRATVERAYTADQSSGTSYQSVNIHGFVPDSQFKHYTLQAPVHANRQLHSTVASKLLKWFTPQVCELVI